MDNKLFQDRRLGFSGGCKKNFFPTLQILVSAACMETPKSTMTYNKMDCLKNYLLCCYYWLAKIIFLSELIQMSDFFRHINKIKINLF